MFWFDVNFLVPFSLPCGFSPITGVGYILPCSFKGAVFGPSFSPFSPFFF